MLVYGLSSGGPSYLVDGLSGVPRSYACMTLYIL